MRTTALLVAMLVGAASESSLRGSRSGEPAFVNRPMSAGDAEALRRASERDPELAAQLLASLEKHAALEASAGHHAQRGLRLDEEVDAAGFGRLRRPRHIVLVLADDAGFNDVGFHDPDFKTPTLDGLRDEGIELTGMHVHPTCSPTRAAILTGNAPEAVGVSGALTPYDADNELTVDVETLPELLKATKRYKNYFVGKWHLGLTSSALGPNARGFDRAYYNDGAFVDFFSGQTAFRGCSLLSDPTCYDGYDVKEDGSIDQSVNPATGGERVYMTQRSTEKAVQYIQEHDASKNMFLYLAYNAPHTPLQAPSELLERCEGIPDTPESAGGQIGVNFRQIICAMMAGLDDGVAEVVAALKAKDMYEDTLILFMSDNGGSTFAGSDNGPFAGQKFELFEGAIRVPAFVSGGAVSSWNNAGRVAGDEVQDTDVFGFLADYAGVLLHRRFIGHPDAISFYKRLRLGLPFGRPHVLLYGGLPGLFSQSLIKTTVNGKRYKFVNNPSAIFLLQGNLNFAARGAKPLGPQLFRLDGGGDELEESELLGIPFDLTAPPSSEDVLQLVLTNPDLDVDDKAAFLLAQGLVAGLQSRALRPDTTILDTIALDAAVSPGFCYLPPDNPAYPSEFCGTPQGPPPPPSPVEDFPLDVSCRPGVDCPNELLGLCTPTPEAADVRAMISVANCTEYSQQAGSYPGGDAAYAGLAADLVDVDPDAAFPFPGGSGFDAGVLYLFQPVPVADVSFASCTFATVGCPAGTLSSTALDVSVRLGPVPNGEPWTQSAAACPASGGCYPACPDAGGAQPSQALVVVTYPQRCRTQTWESSGGIAATVPVLRDPAGNLYALEASRGAGDPELPSGWVLDPDEAIVLDDATPAFVVGPVNAFADPCSSVALNQAPAVGQCATAIARDAMGNQYVRFFWSGSEPNLESIELPASVPLGTPARSKECAALCAAI